MHWAALDGSRQLGSYRGLGRVGVWASLVGGLLLGGCSFNLPARCEGTSCLTSDMGQADLAPAIPDPNLPGPYMVATVQVTKQPSLTSGQLYVPSDDGSTLSTKVASYPLVLLAPAQFMDPLQLAEYAQRLASHGMVAVTYKVETESDQLSYRTVGINLLATLLANQEPSVANHINAARVGLAGYQLGAEMSVAIASQDMKVRGLALIDPQAVEGAGTDIDGRLEMPKVRLTDGQAVLILGEQKSNTPMNGMRPCTNPATDYLKFLEVSPSPTIALYFPNAAHGDFTTTYPDPTCMGGTMPPAETKRLAIKYLTAYFQWTLLDKAAAKDYLTGAGYTADFNQYMITKTEK